MEQTLKRTPRYYNGSDTTSKSLHRLCNSFLHTLKKRKNCTKEEVFKAWYDIMGKQLAKYTEPVSLQKGVFTVKIKNSVLYSTLSTHDKNRVLLRLQKEVPNQVKEIIFWFG